VELGRRQREPGCPPHSLDFDVVNQVVARKPLTRYEELVGQANRAPMWTKERKAAREAANELLPKINKILRSLVPDRSSSAPATSLIWPSSSWRPLARPTVS
jgi:hypothetical protein